MDLQAKRDELTKARDQAIASANFLNGQLAIIDELLAASPLPSVDPPSPEVTDG